MEEATQGMVKKGAEEEDPAGASRKARGVPADPHPRGNFPQFGRAFLWLRFHRGVRRPEGSPPPTERGLQSVRPTGRRSAPALLGTAETCGAGL